MAIKFAIFGLKILKLTISNAFYYRYGRGLGIFPETSLLYLPNALFGLIFYTLIGALSTYYIRVSTIMWLLAVRKACTDCARNLKRVG